MKLLVDQSGDIFWLLIMYTGYSIIYYICFLLNTQTKKIIIDLMMLANIGG